MVVGAIRRSAMRLDGAGVVLAGAVGGALWVGTRRVEAMRVAVGRRRISRGPGTLLPARPRRDHPARANGRQRAVVRVCSWAGARHRPCPPPPAATDPV